MKYLHLRNSSNGFYFLMQDFRGEFVWLGHRFLREYLTDNLNLPKYYETREIALNHKNSIITYINENYDAYVKFCS